MVATDKAYKNARRLRRELSLPEKLLWVRLKRSGRHIRKQHPVGPYILDFYCASAKLAIEVHGFAHDIGDRPERDQARTEWLESQRIQVLRILAKTCSQTRTRLRTRSFVSARTTLDPSTIRLRRTVPLPIASQQGGANDGELFGDAALEDMLPLLAPSGFVWVSWPKKASKVPTDITEDTIRDVCLPIGLVDVKVCAVDSTWSGLKLMKRKSSNSRIAIRSVRVT